MQESCSIFFNFIFSSVERILLVVLFSSQGSIPYSSIFTWEPKNAVLIFVFWKLTPLNKLWHSCRIELRTDTKSQVVKQHVRPGKCPLFITKRLKVDCSTVKDGPIFYFIYVQLLQSYLNLCDPLDYSLPDFSVHGILQARIREWVAMPSSRRCSRPRDWTHICCISCVTGRFFTTQPPGEPICVYIF